VITCRDLAELLLDFLDGSLPPEHRQRIEQHLERCPPCVVYLETYRITITLTRKLPCQPLPAELAHRLRTALTEIRGEQSESTGLV
jgi:anti-sigma factor RsiW